MHVTFWSYSELGQATVYEHRDIYSGDTGLAPLDVRGRAIAIGPGGFVF